MEWKLSNNDWLTLRVAREASANTNGGQQENFVNKPNNESDSVEWREIESNFYWEVTREKFKRNRKEKNLGRTETDSTGKVHIRKNFAVRFSINNRKKDMDGNMTGRWGNRTARDSGIWGKPRSKDFKLSSGSQAIEPEE